MLQGEEVWLDHDDFCRRPSESVHQEDHESAEQVDAEVQDLETRRRCHEQRDGGAR